MYEKAINFFEEFVKKFDLKKDQEKIESYSHKYHHTYRVVEKTQELCDLLNLKKEDIEIAKTIAIFHDLGRFNQLKKTKQYNDIKSNFDHAKESTIILKESNWFQNEFITKEMEEIILFAVFNHNKYEIAPTKNEKNLFFAKLIRDADKLVIMAEINENLINSSISKEVLKEFQNEKLINRKNIQTSLDSFLGILSFPFDLNFKESIIKLEQDDILKPYWLCLEKNIDSVLLEELKEIVKKYLEKRKKEVLC